MENLIRTRICELRKIMKESGIEIYIIPTGDYHQSEYISDYFKEREYITGFTGSAGTAVITEEEACLWTDGRYFVQAEKELEGTGVVLFRSGMEGVPTVHEYIDSHLKSGGCLGFDARIVSAGEGIYYSKKAEKKNAKLCVDSDLTDRIWTDRPAFPESRAFILTTEYAGKTPAQKLEEVRRIMEEKGAKVHVLSDLCDIAWLTNLRGADIDHVPVLLAHMLVTDKEAMLYVNRKSINLQIEEYLKDNGIQVKAYDRFYDELADITEGHVLADMHAINYKTKCSLKAEITVGYNPETLLKAVKNPVEAENIRKAHIKDAVAMVKFMYWLKNTTGKEKITEYQAARYIDGLRAGLENYIDISFDTISAYKGNAAMMHYEPSAEDEVELLQEGMLLVDSGGHYKEGTTDITRTFVLGEISEEEREMFTAVVIANLELANAKFLYGCSGRNLDILARQPLWKKEKDYRCGTGHGVGYMLNVHEGPNAFRWRALPGLAEIPLEEGMVTTDEPGIYEEGRYGIRIENELLCRKAGKNEYGQFMEFENLTYVPVDLDGTDPAQMTQAQKDMLNQYHRNVYAVVAEYLEEEEKEWLKKYTRAI